MNYRLGAMGWLSGPSLQAAGGVANAGLYDQRLAIEWVSKNIHLFGGDPNQITVIGESAGGKLTTHDSYTIFSSSQVAQLNIKSLPLVELKTLVSNELYLNHPGFFQLLVNTHKKIQPKHSSNI